MMGKRPADEPDPRRVALCRCSDKPWSGIVIQSNFVDAMFCDRIVHTNGPQKPFHLTEHPRVSPVSGANAQNQSSMPHAN